MVNAFCCSSVTAGSLLRFKEGEFLSAAVGDALSVATMVVTFMLLEMAAEGLAVDAENAAAWFAVEVLAVRPASGSTVNVDLTVDSPVALGLLLVLFTAAVILAPRRDRFLTPSVGGLPKVHTYNLPSLSYGVKARVPPPLVKCRRGTYNYFHCRTKYKKCTIYESLYHTQTADRHTHHMRHICRNPGVLCRREKDDMVKRTRN